MPRTLLAALWILLGLTACSQGVTPPGDAAMGADTSQPPGDAASMDAAVDMDAQSVLDAPPIDNAWIDAPTHERMLSIGPLTLMPGQETTVCVLRRLGNMGPEYLQRVRAHLSDASHHLIVYRSTADTEQLTPMRCNGFSGVTGVTTTGMIETPLLIAQNHDAQLTMPAGVGMNLAANQMIRIEYHAVNATSAPVQIQGDVWLDTIEQNGSLQPADVLFWGNVRFAIPPAGSPGATDYQVHFFHRPWSGVHIFGLTSHTHHLGTLGTISIATNTTTDSSMSTDIREIHRSTSWSEPPLTLFDPALTLAADQGLHLVCHYNNVTTSTVSFGESVNQEMCFMWAYYYPAPRGTQICVEGYSASGAQCFPP